MRIGGNAMNRIINFINTKWTDAVWSKVFATGIIAIFSAIGLLLTAIYKRIPIASIWNKSIYFLNSHTFSINYLTFVIILIILLIILIPMISLKIIQFQLKHIKFPKHLKEQRFNLLEYLKGNWNLKYTHIASQISEIELVEIINGNQYYINKVLTFILTDIQFDESKKELRWTKTIYLNNQKHSRETLVLYDQTMEGTDDVAYKIYYTRQTI
jgi:hypothetical protein